MNKKTNTLLFLLAGTVVNVILAIFCIGSLLLLIRWLGHATGNPIVSIVPFAFIAGILLAMIIYQRLTKWVIDRFNLEDKLDPLFPAGKRKKNRQLD
jgi:membrane-associated protease RseP (regulator of RpoE activity)